MNKLTKAVVVGFVGLELLTNMGCEVVGGLIGTAGSIILRGEKEDNGSSLDYEKGYNVVQNENYAGQDRGEKWQNLQEY